MNAWDWLLMWEPARYFGKHDKRYPADGAVAYRYNDAIHGNDAWLRDWSRVHRAIPVEGTMEKLSWSQSPQVKAWLDKPKPSLMDRLRAWWRR